MEITITCDGCRSSYQVTRDKTAPKNAVSMGCNWCGNCEANDTYDEWYNYGENDDKEKEIPVDPNQLCMPFIMDDFMNDPILYPEVLIDSGVIFKLD